MCKTKTGKKNDFGFVEGALSMANTADSPLMVLFKEVVAP